MTDEYLGISAICGEEGTGKTTMALTWPKPLVHFDIDVGGYRRAAWRLPPEGTTSKAYPRPIQVDKMMGQTKGPAMEIRFPKKVEGMKELWQAIVVDFVAACQDAKVATLVMDSATLLWNIAHNAHLQELQEKQIAQGLKDDNALREKLQPMEYGPANDRMRQLLHSARAFSKNLVMTHYPRDVYRETVNSKGEIQSYVTGEKEMDGFKETAKLVDLIVWVRIDQKPDMITKELKNVPLARITKCGIDGMGLDAVGRDVVATYQGIYNLRNMMRMAKS